MLIKSVRCVASDIVTKTGNVPLPRISFYKANDLYKFDHKNVVYMAYVGNVNGEEMFKYGKTCKLFEREYNAHRKNFERFDMHCVKITDNKDVVEELFEKELQIRNVHRTAIIKTKRQTELFTITEDYPLEYITNLLGRIVKDNPSYEVMMHKKRIEKLKTMIESLENNPKKRRI